MVKRRRYSELSHIEEIRVEAQHGSLARVEAGLWSPRNRGSKNWYSLVIDSQRLDSLMEVATVSNIAIGCAVVSNVMCRCCGDVGEECFCATSDDKQADDGRAVQWSQQIGKSKETRGKWRPERGDLPPWAWCKCHCNGALLQLDLIPFKSSWFTSGFRPTDLSFNEIARSAINPTWGRCSPVPHSEQ
jgi:hypothetical protein